MRRRRVLPTFAAWLCMAVAALSPLAAGAAGAVAPDVAADRARIQREEAQAEAAFKAREAACQQQFAVTACVNEARVQRRAVLERLRNERVVLDDAQRKRRAAERLAGIEERRDALAAASAAAASAPPPRSAASHASAPRQPRPVKPPHPPADRSAEQSQASERAAAQAERASQAAAHRAKVEERNARRPAKAASLPVPSGRP